MKLDLPLRAERGNSTLVPLDAVSQDSVHAWVLTLEESHAKNTEVTVGRIYGSFVEVTEGITEDSRIILNKSVIEGDAIALPVR